MIDEFTRFLPYITALLCVAFAVALIFRAERLESEERERELIEKERQAREAEKRGTPTEFEAA